MSKKLLLLISIVLLLGLAGSTSAAAKFEYRASWWSDLDPCNSLWSEPNNWWTVDKYYDDLDDSNDHDYMESQWYVKQPNQVPDINCAAVIGKGGARMIYPRTLHDLVVGGYSMTDPTFDVNAGTLDAYWVMCGGGESFDPNVGGGAEDPDANNDDPCRHHDFWMTGGTLNIGEPQTWDGYDTVYYDGMFYGQWSTGRISIAAVPSPGSGTMHMSGGTVNVGGHIGLGSWGATGLLDMTGGEINITQGLYASVTYWGGTGQVNLHGGTINARYFTIQNGYYSSGSMDIAGGKMVLERNELQKMQDYYDGNVDRATITLYGGVSHGDIVTDGNFPDANGKRVAFSLDFSVSNDGMTTVQTFLTDPNQAWNPSPPNGATAARGPAASIKRPVLSWSAGDNATNHDLYFGTSWDDVNDATTATTAVLGHDPCSWTVNTDLVSLGSYFWRIDENPGPTKGQVWGFTMANLAKAGLPIPGDGEVDVNPAVDLSWVAGIYAQSHDVYFGTNSGDVNDASTSVDPNNVFMGNQVGNTFDTNNYDANGLKFSTTYYWRIDECNSAGDPLWPGDVWSFTTSDHIVVDDMDSYADHTAIRAVWRDFYSGINPKNKAELFVETNPDLVRDGNSMMFYYRNTTSTGGVGPDASYAEVNAVDLEVGTNWTSSGVEALVLYFRGHTANGQEDHSNYTLANDRMWVSLLDGDSNEGIVRLLDMNDVMEASWHEWNIDLQDPNFSDVNLANIAKVYIGFGGVKGDSPSKYGAGCDDVIGDTVWFDDIGLWPIRCVPAESLAADFTGDCVVDEQDLDMIAAEWLARDGSVLATAPTDVNLVARWQFEGDYTDSNGNNDGFPYGDVTTVSDPCRGNVLECDGDGDYVEIPGSNTPGGVFDIRNDITLSAWIKLSVIDNSWPAIISKGDDEWGWRIARNGSKGETLEFACAGISGGALEPYGNVVGSVPVVDDLWHHAAGVYDGSKVCVYVDGILDNCEDGSGPMATSSPDVHVRIGSNEDAKGTAWTGYIDDVRVYNCALQPGEIAVLAGLQGSIYVPLSVPANLVNLVPKDPPGAPFDPNNRDIVNFLDYGKLAEDWLKESPWPPRP